MPGIDIPRSPIANPDQAAELHSWLLHATDSGSVKFECTAPNLPEAVTFHFPEPLPDAKSTSHSVRAEIESTYSPRVPKTIGNLGNMYFLQKEVLDRAREEDGETVVEEVTYVARVGYHIEASSDGILDWRLHIVNAIQGAYEQRELARYISKMMGRGLKIDFQGLSERVKRQETEARQLGLSIVYEDEAESVIDYCRTLI